jgi:hypothetical protein
VLRFKKVIVDWLAAPINWQEDMPDNATAVGSAKSFFENEDIATQDKLGVWIMGGPRGSGYYEAELRTKVKGANEIAEKLGLWYRFREIEKVSEQERDGEEVEVRGPACGTKTVSDAQTKLEDMTLAECMSAVAVDVASKRDEYRSIDPHELAPLLGIDDADQPGGDWSFVWFVPRLSVRDILFQWNEEFISELLESHVTAERCKEISANINLLKRNETELSRTRFDFLTEEEKQTIERLYMESEAKNDGTKVLAFYYINAPDGKWLSFEALIEDDGGCVDLKTPYDERDGAFHDLSESLIVEDRR